MKISKRRRTSWHPLRRSSEKASDAGRRKWKASPLLILTLTVAFAGVTTLTYSTAASWFSAVNQGQVVERYDESINDLDPTAKEQLLAARAYNEALSSGALLAANASVPEGAGETSGAPTEDYWKLLSTPSGVMSRLQIPAIEADLPVYHGTSEETLDKGIGHLKGTSLPVGGISTHSVLTGHRGLPSATLFTHLDQVKVGDAFTITTLGKVLSYRVTEVRVVDPEDTETLRQVEGEDLVTLVTCTPLGINTHRILVTGERETPTPEEAYKTAQAPAVGAGFPWWAIAYLAALIAIGWYGWWAGRPHVSNGVTVAR